MVPNEDGRRLVEGRFDLLAALVAVKLTLEAVIEAAIDHTRAEYEKAWEGLVAASGVVIRETEETRRARRKVEAASARAVATWGFVVDEVGSTLLRVDPDAPPTAEVLAERQAWAKRLVSVSARELERSTTERRLEVLRFALQVAGEPVPEAVPGEVVALVTGRLEPVRAALAAAQAELYRELREDREAYEALEAARAAFDRAQSAHFRQVQSALIAQGREGELGRFILSQDAAYRARRAARRPLQEEEGIVAVASSLGVAPEAIETPVEVPPVG
jgi:hypothetical protein